MAARLLSRPASPASCPASTANSANFAIAAPTFLSCAACDWQPPMRLSMSPSSGHAAPIRFLYCGTPCTVKLRVLWSDARAGTPQPKAALYHPIMVMAYSAIPFCPAGPAAASHGVASGSHARHDFV